MGSALEHFHKQLQLMQREADEPEGAEEAAEKEEAPPGEGDNEAQYEITSKGEAADAQVLADATQEQFEKEDGAAAGEEESQEDEGAAEEDEPDAVPEVAQPEEEAKKQGDGAEDKEKQSKPQKQGRLRPATEAADAEEAAAGAEPGQEFLEEGDERE